MSAMLDRAASGERPPVESAAPTAEPAGERPSDRGGRGPRFPASSPVRLLAYAAAIVAMAFAQDSGKIVADTKYDLLTDPLHFLVKGMRLWDPNAALGQIPDQSYGYLWPMGPFFVVGKWVHLNPWVIQRGWWAALLLIGFFGILRLTRELGIGNELGRVAAAFTFVLTPRITSLIGVVSAEVWPMALAPWVLVPLIRGSREGSVRRAGALSALALVCAGGINAVAVGAILPLGVIWIFTRARGPRRWRLFGWWTGFTILGTAWWWAPLLILGRYAPPFLDYIENASITTLPTDLTRSMLGLSDWVAYFGGIDFRAGLTMVGTPYLVVDAGIVVALGLLGMALKDNPERRFLVVSFLAGMLLVGFGYDRTLAGFVAAQRNELLDNALAAVRNVHKFDVVLRIPLVLGLAHAVTVLPAFVRSRGSAVAERLLTFGALLALLGLVAPWAYNRIPAGGAFDEMPNYWQQAASYLAQHDDGSVSLELPASTFGIYNWGNTHDDVLQGLAQSPWAIRNIVPLAEPGSVVFLDAVTKEIESGQPSSTLARYLASNGVGTLVVRNDLDRVMTGVPDPAYMSQLLSRTPGIAKVASFGPFMGSPPYVYATDAKHTRVVQSAGISSVTRAIDVYRVFDPAQASLSSPREVLVGDPGSPTDAAAAGESMAPRLLAADNVGGVTGQVLTDDMKRREMYFPAVRSNQSNTMSATAPWQLHGKQHTHRLVDNEARWDTVETWTGGIASVTASSSQAYANATPPLMISGHPGAALDGDPATGWTSARDQDPKKQWWQVGFEQPRSVHQVTVRLGDYSAPLKALTFTGGGVSVTLPAPRPGQSLTLTPNLPQTSTMRITPVYTGQLLTGSVVLSEVGIDDLQPQRWLTLPRPITGVPVDRVQLSRDPGRNPCAVVQTAYACDPVLVAPGEDGDTLARIVDVGTGGSYRVDATASLRRNSDVWKALLENASAKVSVSPKQDSAEAAVGWGAMIDGDPSTTWQANSSHPVITLTFPRPVLLDRLSASVNPGASASQPQELLLRAGKRSKVVNLNPDGAAVLPHWTVKRLTMRVDATYAAFRWDGEFFTELPPGISELEINGKPLSRSVFQNAVFPCGAGPQIRIGSTVYDTSLTANTRDLIRGASVPLTICGVPHAQSGTVEVLAMPTSTLRVDSVSLTSPRAAQDPLVPVKLTRNGDDLPTSVSLPSRTTTQVLTLPQNINAGWQATLDGQVLRPVRMDGWKQGWVVPAGPAGAVRLSFTPGSTFSWSIAVGVALAGLVVVGALLPLRRSRRVLPALAIGRPAGFDVVLLLAVAGLLTGWLGLALVGAGLLLVRRFGELDRLGGWGVLSGVSALVAVAALTWEPIKSHTWAIYWAQGWSMLAVACVGVAMLAATHQSGARSSSFFNWSVRTRRGSSRMAQPGFLNRRIGRSKNR